MMRQFLFLFLIILTNSLFGQISNYFICEDDDYVVCIIDDKKIEIFREVYFDYPDPIRLQIVSSTYRMSSDTLFFDYEGTKKYLVFLSEDVMMISSEIIPFFPKVTKFYLIKQYDDYGNVFLYGSWKNGNKDGNWFFLSPENKKIKITYKAGIEIARDTISGLFKSVIEIIQKK